MSSSNNSNSNQPVVPSAREALNKFKMEAAQEVGVNLKQGYNGDLTSREASACRKSQRHQETFRCRLTHARGTHRSPPRPGFP